MATSSVVKEVGPRSCDCFGELGSEMGSVVDQRVTAGQSTLVTEPSSSSQTPVLHNTRGAVDAGDEARGRARHNGGGEARSGIAVHRLVA